MTQPPPVTSAGTSQPPPSPRRARLTAACHLDRFFPAGQSAHALAAGRAPETPSGPQALAAPAGAHLTYYGGRVISNVQVVQVLYGGGIYTPEVQNTASPSIATFYQAVTNSPYYDWLTEYNTPAVGVPIRRSGVAPSWGNTRSRRPPRNSGSTVDDVQIKAELTAQIAAGHLPAPTTRRNANTYYALYFPANVTITDRRTHSGVQFCAYHGPSCRMGQCPRCITGCSRTSRPGE